ncbi:xanthine dehydrogenase family protein molybdopterin-binding subunit [Scytonema sp. NUACC26]|uniref:xanthine dehydrogenase family protein molybdopterin-binding subunit n=1 Tax=Scytonema sp. NUACC26 TaxID=3140176 RepID=UPI0034DC7A74
MVNEVVGKPIDRSEARIKVTGEARYTAEWQLENLTHAVIVQSAIANGRVIDIDTTAAETAPGVLAIVTHKNAPKLNPLPEDLTEKKPCERRQPLQDDIVYYYGQHLAIVVAETLEQAEYAAELVRVNYEEQPPHFQIEQEKEQASEPELFFDREKLQVHRGDVAQALATADIKLEQTYTTPIEHHNPIEMSATIANWDGEELTLHDTTRWLKGVQRIVAHSFGMPQSQVRAICPYIGGAFGSKGFIWGHVILTAIAAKQVNRPVKLVLTRPQMFTSVGYRPRTIQTLTLSASKDGKLTAIRHAIFTQTSMIADFIEPCGLTTCNLYACPNLEVTHKLVRLNYNTPTFMRAPGEASGMFALESALDELAIALNIDPVTLRLMNDTDINPETGQPWSSKYLKECYQQAAERFGWQQRNPTPRSMKDGNLLVGWGMATAAYPSRRQPASAKVIVFADGRVVVQSATHDFGNGTYTGMNQLAADALGLPLEKVQFQLGDSQFPPAPVSGGSWTTVSVGTAVVTAAKATKSKLIRMAVADKASPLYGVEEEEIVVSDGRLFPKNQPDKTDSYAKILNRTQQPSVETQSDTEPGDEQKKYSFQSFGAHFAEVKINPLLGEIRVTRFVGVFDSGTILNPKLVRSQLIGGITFGIGMALMEETVSDPNLGGFVTANLADYLVPVHADIPDIDVAFINKPDPYINPMGARGLGELGIVGAAAAIANAVYHATGKRIRELPITPDKLMFSEKVQK